MDPIDDVLNEEEDDVVSLDHLKEEGDDEDSKFDNTDADHIIPSGVDEGTEE